MDDSPWLRRARSIPLATGATLVAVASMPIWLVVLAVADLVRGRIRFPMIRCALFAIQYGVNVVIEVIAAPILWLGAGAGTRLGRPRWVELHYRFLMWSVRILVRRADQLLGITMNADETSGIFTPAPVIVLSRHLSLVDAAFPPLAYAEADLRGIGIFMAEMLADPSMDLIYQRAGHVYIDRSDGETATAAIASVGERLDDGTAASIFPEGRLFRPELLERAIDRIGADDPERADRIGHLRHLLPPRAAGVNALLDAAPGVDVVVLGHVGLESATSLVDLLGRAPLDVTAVVFGWRIDRSTIPEDDDERVRWLDEIWIELDDRIEERIGPQ